MATDLQGEVAVRCVCECHRGVKGKARRPRKGTTTDLLASKCPHGLTWRECTDTGCQAILRLPVDANFAELVKIFRNQFEEPCGMGSPRPAPENKDGYEIDQREVIADVNVEDDIPVFKDDVKKAREANSGYTPELIRAMVQSAVITPEQREVLRLRLKGLTWNQVAKDIGISARTARRLAQAGFQPSRPSPLKDGSIVARIVRARNVRGGDPFKLNQVRYYKVVKHKFGEWEETLLKSIPDPDPKPKIKPGISKLIRQSPMRALYGALIGHYGQVGIRNPPPEVSVKEWKFNLKVAERILLKNRRKVVGLSAQDIYYSLGRGKKLCPACGTPMLIGFRLGGELITRRRAFCDDTCKKNAKRRSKLPAKIQAIRRPNR